MRSDVVLKLADLFSLDHYFKKWNLLGELEQFLLKQSAAKPVEIRTKVGDFAFRLNKGLVEKCEKLQSGALSLKRTKNTKESQRERDYERIYNDPAAFEKYQLERELSTFRIINEGFRS